MLVLENSEKQEIFFKLEKVIHFSKLHHHLIPFFVPRRNSITQVALLLLSIFHLGYEEYREWENSRR